MKKQIVGLALVVFLTSVPDAVACTGVSGTPATWLRDAKTIVRVRALEEVGTRRQGTVAQRREKSLATGRDYDTWVRFIVLETLKGKAIPAFFEFEGELYDRDDLNNEPVPYTWVRPGGRGGDCYAHNYKQGRQYLLILGGEKGLSPYWRPMAATNEQLVEVNDPWLAWVRKALQPTGPQ